MSREPVIVAKNLGKKYWLYPTVTRRVLGCFLGPERVGASPITVLSGLSFELYPGEAIALIGKNGAGKSTALQILAGIIPPSEGEYVTRGRVCALLELGAGFNPEFTGRQNIHIAGLLSGLSHEEICAAEASIIDFAEIGDYIDQPVKFYSSGMFLRLAFAVALAGKPDILIVDEALAVGDIFFRQKCYARLRELRAQGMAVMLVTHSMEDVTQFCDRAILLKKGEQEGIGLPKDIMLQYLMLIDHEKLVSNKVNIESGIQKEICIPENDIVTEKLDDSWSQVFDKLICLDTSKQETLIPGVCIEKFLITDENNIQTSVFVQGSILRLFSVFDASTDICNPVTGTTIWNQHSMPVFCAGSGQQQQVISYVQGGKKLYMHQDIRLDILCGEYTITHALGTVRDKHFARERTIWDHGMWSKKCLRIVEITLQKIDIVLPERREPTRLRGFGLVDLQTRTKGFVR